MGFLKWFILSMILSSTALAEKGIAVDPFEDFDIEEQADFDDEYLSDYFRCELVVIIIDFSQNYRRSRHSFVGQGRSWGDSRNDSFQRYGQWINRGNFWRSSFNHQFYFNNCFG